MQKQQKRQQQAKVLRVFRKIHRLTGAALFFFFMFVSISGLLLGWKKHSGDLILAQTRRGASDNLAEWLPLDSLQKNAQRYLKDSVGAGFSDEIDRIDIRKDKGMVKFTFTEHYQGLQLDGTTGKLLHIEQRRSDFIEQIHDGSIVDRYLGISNGGFKLVYTSIMGLALMVFSVTGFWLWYGPKRMRQS